MKYIQIIDIELYERQMEVRKNIIKLYFFGANLILR